MKCCTIYTPDLVEIRICVAALWLPKVGHVRKMLCETDITVLYRKYLEMPSGFAGLCTMHSRQWPFKRAFVASWRAFDGMLSLSSLLEEDPLDIECRKKRRLPHIGLVIYYTIIWIVHYGHGNKDIKTFRFLLFMVRKGLILFQNTTKHTVVLYTSVISILWNRNNLNFYNNVSCTLK